jgi:hypothetical protein
MQPWRLVEQLILLVKQQMMRHGMRIFSLFGFLMHCGKQRGGTH